MLCWVVYYIHGSPTMRVSSDSFCTQSTKRCHLKRLSGLCEFFLWKLFRVLIFFVMVDPSKQCTALKFCFQLKKMPQKLVWCCKQLIKDTAKGIIISTSSVWEVFVFQKRWTVDWWPTSFWASFNFLNGRKCKKIHTIALEDMRKTQMKLNIKTMIFVFFMFWERWCIWNSFHQVRLLTTDSTWRFWEDGTTVSNKKRPNLWQMCEWFFHHDKAPVTQLYQWANF